MVAAAAHGRGRARRRCCSRTTDRVRGRPPHAPHRIILLWPVLDRGDGPDRPGLRGGRTFARERLPRDIPLCARTGEHATAAPGSGSVSYTHLTLPTNRA